MLKCKKSFKSRPSVVPRPTCCLSAVLGRARQSLARLCDFSERALFSCTKVFGLNLLQLCYCFTYHKTSKHYVQAWICGLFMGRLLPLSSVFPAPEAAFDYDSGGFHPASVVVSVAVKP